MKTVLFLFFIITLSLISNAHSKLISHIAKNLKKISSSQDIKQSTTTQSTETPKTTTLLSPALISNRKLSVSLPTKTELVVSTEDDGEDDGYTFLQPPNRIHVAQTSGTHDLDDDQ
jgi:hypothetical protein